MSDRGTPYDRIAGSSDWPQAPCRCVEVDAYGVDRTACRADQHREPDRLCRCGCPEDAHDAPAVGCAFCHPRECEPASLTGGSTETADREPADPAHTGEQS